MDLESFFAKPNKENVNSRVRYMLVGLLSLLTLLIIQLTFKFMSSAVMNTILVTLAILYLIYATYMFVNLPELQMKE